MDFIAAISGSTVTVMNPHAKKSVVTETNAARWPPGLRVMGAPGTANGRGSKLMGILHQGETGRQKAVAERQDCGAHRGRIIRERGARDGGDRGDDGFVGPQTLVQAPRQPLDEGRRQTPADQD